MLRENLRDLVHLVEAGIEHDDLGIMAAQHLDLRRIARGRRQLRRDPLGLAADQAVEALRELRGVFHRRVHEDDVAHRRGAGVHRVARETDGVARLKARALGAVRPRSQARNGVGPHGGAGPRLPRDTILRGRGRSPLRGCPADRRLLPRQQGSLHVALAGRLRARVFGERHRLAQRAACGLLDQVGVVGTGLHGRRMRLSWLQRLHHGRLRARRGWRRHELGRHQVAPLQRLEQRLAPKEGMLNFTTTGSGPQAPRSFLQIHANLLQFSLQALPRFILYERLWLMATMSFSLSTPAACLSFRLSSK
ncbi:hypothetical protein CDEF62S_03691 [Castellaniella defragrans]